MLVSCFQRQCSTVLARLTSYSLRQFAAEAVPVEHDDLQHRLRSQLSDIKAAGTYKQEFAINSPQGPAICEDVLCCPPALPFARLFCQDLSMSPRAVLHPLVSAGCAAVDGVEGQLLNFCSNNYLGLSNHPRLVQAAHKALDTHGFGLSSVRFICGTQVGTGILPKVVPTANLAWMMRHSCTAS